MQQASITTALDAGALCRFVDRSRPALQTFEQLVEANSRERDRVHHVEVDLVFIVQTALSATSGCEPGISDSQFALVARALLPAAPTLMSALVRADEMRR